MVTKDNFHFYTYIFFNYQFSISFILITTVFELSFYLDKIRNLARSPKIIPFKKPSIALFQNQELTHRQPEPPSTASQLDHLPEQLAWAKQPQSVSPASQRSTILAGQLELLNLSWSARDSQAQPASQSPLPQPVSQSPSPQLTRRSILPHPANQIILPGQPARAAHPSQPASQSPFLYPASQSLFLQPARQPEILSPGQPSRSAYPSSQPEPLKPGRAARAYVPVN